MKKIIKIITSLIDILFSPLTYLYVSISKADKRTDYRGEEIAKKAQLAWDKEFNSTIEVVIGDEWHAGNLSYHLKSRPVWEGFFSQKKLKSFKNYMCVDKVCVGSK